MFLGPTGSGIGCRLGAMVVGYVGFFGYDQSFQHLYIFATMGT